MLSQSPARTTLLSSLVCAVPHTVFHLVAASLPGKFRRARNPKRPKNNYKGEIDFKLAAQLLLSQRLLRVVIVRQDVRVHGVPGFIDVVTISFASVQAMQNRPCPGSGNSPGGLDKPDPLALHKLEKSLLGALTLEVSKYVTPELNALDPLGADHDLVITVGIRDFGELAEAKMEINGILMRGQQPLARVSRILYIPCRRPK